MANKTKDTWKDPVCINGRVYVEEHPKEISRKYGHIYAFIFATIKRVATEELFTLYELALSSGMSIHTVWRVLNDKYADKGLCHKRALVIIQSLGARREQKVAKAVIAELDKHDPDRTDYHIQALRKYYGKFLYTKKEGEE